MLVFQAIAGVLFAATTLSTAAYPLYMSVPDNRILRANDFRLLRSPPNTAAAYKQRQYSEGRAVNIMLLGRALRDEDRVRNRSCIRNRCHELNGFFF